MKFNFASRNEKGLVRKENQDSVLCMEKSGVFAVADGMGGGSGGALASQIVCEELGRCGSPADFKAKVSDIGHAVDVANSRIFAYAKEHGFRQMGSTVAMLAVDGTKCARGAVGHVGDSRVYRVRGKAAELMTRDHSVGAELAASAGAAAASKLFARSNPLAHILTRAIGTRSEVQVEWREIDIADGDRFVVCSDGVHDVIETDELAAIVANCEIGNAADRLERIIVARGAPDNYSFVIVETGNAR